MRVFIFQAHAVRIWFEVDAFFYINAGYMAVDGHPFFFRRINRRSGRTPGSWL